MRYRGYMLALLIVSLSGCTASSSDTQTSVALVTLPMYPNTSSSTTEPVTQAGTIAGIITTFETSDSPATIGTWYQALLRDRGWPETKIDDFPGVYGVATDYDGCPLKNIKITFKPASMDRTRVTIDNRLLSCGPTVTP